MASEGMFGIHEQNYFLLDLLMDRHHVAESNVLCINPADVTV